MIIMISAYFMGLTLQDKARYGLLNICILCQFKNHHATENSVTIYYDYVGKTSIVRISSPMLLLNKTDTLIIDRFITWLGHSWL